MGVKDAVEDTDAMINIPDGFDSRKYLFTQPYFRGIHKKQAVNLN